MTRPWTSAPKSRWGRYELDCEDPDASTLFEDRNPHAAHYLINAPRNASKLASSRNTLAKSTCDESEIDRSEATLATRTNTRQKFPLVSAEAPRIVGQGVPLFKLSEALSLVLSCDLNPPGTSPENAIPYSQRLPDTPVAAVCACRQSETHLPILQTSNV
jgi:hypothetical protein